jgi:hypothetical protein
MNARGNNQSIEDHARRKRGERAKLCGEGEDDVEVPDVEHSLPTRFDPSLLGQRLTLGCCRARPMRAKAAASIRFFEGRSGGSRPAPITDMDWTTGSRLS